MMGQSAPNPAAWRGRISLDRRGGHMRLLLAFFAVLLPLVRAEFILTGYNGWNREYHTGLHFNWTSSSDDAGEIEYTVTDIGNIPPPEGGITAPVAFVESIEVDKETGEPFLGTCTGVRDTDRFNQTLSGKILIYIRTDYPKLCPWGANHLELEAFKPAAIIYSQDLANGGSDDNALNVPWATMFSIMAADRPFGMVEFSIRASDAKALRRRIYENNETITMSIQGTGPISDGDKAALVDLYEHMSRDPFCNDQGGRLLCGQPGKVTGWSGGGGGGSGVGNWGNYYGGMAAAEKLSDWSHAGSDNWDNLVNGTLALQTGHIDPCRTRLMGIYCIDGRVVLIQGSIHFYALGGMTPSIGNLTELKVLSFGLVPYFEPKGITMPCELGLLAQLRTIHLHTWFGHRTTFTFPDCALSGLQKLAEFTTYKHNVVWEGNSQLSSLEELAVHYDELTRTPIDPKRFPKLRQYVWSNAALKGKLPSFKGLGLLEVISIGNEVQYSLQGEIDADSFDGLPALLRLRLPDNSITGPIPTLNESSKLETLDLHGNRLHGHIPGAWQRMGEITWIDLSKNEIGDDNIDCLAGLEGHPAMIHLDLSYNNFSVDFGSAYVLQGLSRYINTKLKYLDISHNSFRNDGGSLTSAYTYLQIYDVSHNAFSGEPYQDGPAMPNMGLVLMDLSSNRWNSISGSLSAINAQVLVEINLRDNPDFQYTTMNFPKDFVPEYPPVPMTDGYGKYTFQCPQWASRSNVRTKIYIDPRAYGYVGGGAYTPPLDTYYSVDPSYGVSLCSCLPGYYLPSGSELPDCVLYPDKVLYGGDQGALNSQLADGKFESNRMRPGMDTKYVVETTDVAVVNGTESTKAVHLHFPFHNLSKKSEDTLIIFKGVVTSEANRVKTLDYSSPASDFNLSVIGKNFVMQFTSRARSGNQWTANYKTMATCPAGFAENDRGAAPPCLPKQRCTLDNVSCVLVESCSFDLKRTWQCAFTNPGICNEVSVTVPSGGVVEFDCSYVPVDSRIGIAIIVMCLATVFYTAGFAAYTYHIRETGVMVLSSVPFCLAFLCGCALTSFATLSLLGENNTSLCILRFWFLPIAALFAYSCLFVKIYRIWRLFNNKKLIRLKITNKQLAFGVAGIIGVYVIIYIAVTAGDTPQSDEDREGPGGIFPYQKCHYGTIASVSVAAYALAILVSGLFLSFSVRNVNPLFAESKHMMFAMYNATLLVILGAIVVFASDSTAGINNLVIAVIVDVVGISCIGFVFIPKFVNKHKTVNELLSEKKHTKNDSTAPGKWATGMSLSMGESSIDESSVELVEALQKEVSILRSKLKAAKPASPPLTNEGGNSLSLVASSGVVTLPTFSASQL